MGTSDSADGESEGYHHSVSQDYYWKVSTRIAETGFPDKRSEGSVGATQIAPIRIDLACRQIVVSEPSTYGGVTAPGYGNRWETAIPTAAQPAAETTKAVTTPHTLSQFTVRLGTAASAPTCPRHSDRLQPYQRFTLVLRTASVRASASFTPTHTYPCAPRSSAAPLRRACDSVRKVPCS